MSCNRQPGPRVFCDFIESVTGEKVSQDDWHQIKKMAEKDRYRPLSRKRMSLDESKNAFYALSHTLRHEDGGSTVMAEREMIDQLEDTGSALLEDANVTEATVGIVRYMNKYGVRDSLAKARRLRAHEKRMKGVVAPVGLTEWKERDFWKHCEFFPDAYKAEDGSYRWASNDNVPPRDVVDNWVAAGLITGDERERSAEVRDIQTRQHLAEYAERRANMTDEERAEEAFELRAAFGDEPVVDIITGERLNEN